MEENKQTVRQKRIEKLRAELLKQQDIAEEAQKKDQSNNAAACQGRKSLCDPE